MQGYFFVTKEFYTLKEIEAERKIERPRLRRDIKSGRLKAKKVGRCLIVSGDELRSFISIHG